MLDLFAGCGGLTDGFMQTGNYQDIAAVEWKKPQVLTLRHRLETKWNKKDADESILHFDIQREKELFEGWNNDPVYGSNRGLCKKSRWDRYHHWWTSLSGLFSCWTS